MITCPNLLQPFTWLFFTIVTTSVSAQSSIADSIQGADIRAAISTFQRDLGAGKDIYTGPEHRVYLPKIEGQAYFETKDWRRGSVCYDGVLYENEWLLYDVVKDNVVLKRNDGFPIELRGDKISSFLLPNHVFVNITRNDSLQLTPGFYEQLAKGALTILVKHETKMDEKVEETQIRQRFIESTTYYAVKNKRAIAIKNAKSVLALLDKDKSETEQYLKRNGIRYKQNPVLTLTTMATLYNKNHY